MKRPQLVFLPLAALYLVAAVLQLPRWNLHPLATGCIALVLAGSFILNRHSLGSRRPYENRESSEIARALAQQGVELRSQRLASDAHWEETLYVGHLLRARYLGIVTPSEPDIRRELDEGNVYTLFIWGDRAAAENYLSGLSRGPLLEGKVPFAVFQR